MKHLKRCQCPECVARRFNALNATLKEKMRESKYAAPLDAERTVYVRAHFRKQANYLTRDPGLQSLWGTFIKALVRGAQKETKKRRN